MSDLAKAIIETPSLDGLRLRALAYEKLKACALDPRRAVGDFLTAVRSDRHLVFELFGYEAVRDRALAYLDEAAADMLNETEGREARSSSESRIRTRSLPSAPVSDDGEAQSVRERQTGPRSPSSEALQPFSDHGDAQRDDERPIVIRAPSSEAGGGDAHPAHESRDQLRSPSPVIPLPKRGAAELGAIKATAPRSAFDSIMLRDRRSIGDLQWSAIDRFIRDNTYEAALLRRVKAYNPPADLNALVRDVVPLVEFERMVQQAAEEVAEEAQ